MCTCVAARPVPAHATSALTRAIGAFVLFIAIASYRDRFGIDMNARSRASSACRVTSHFADVLVPEAHRLLELVHDVRLPLGAREVLGVAKKATARSGRSPTCRASDPRRHAHIGKCGMSLRDARTLLRVFAPARAPDPRGQGHTQEWGGVTAHRLALLVAATNGKLYFRFAEQSGRWWLTHRNHSI